MHDHANVWANAAADLVRLSIDPGDDRCDNVASKRVNEWHPRYSNLFPIEEHYATVQGAATWILRRKRDMHGRV